MERKTIPQLIAMVSLVLLLNLAYFLDIWIDHLRDSNAQVFDLNTVILWAYALSRLVMAAAFLSLFWYLLTKTGKGWLVPVVFILLGALIVFSPLLYFTFLGSPFVVTPSSLFLIAGAQSLAAGVLALFLSK